MVLSISIWYFIIIIVLIITFYTLYSRSRSERIDIIHYKYQQDILTDRELEFLTLLNDYRIDKKMAKLLPDAFSGNLAYKHNIYQITTNSSSHEGNGSRNKELMSRGALSVGEIVGDGWYSSLGAFRAFLKSEDHYKIINRKNYNVCGIDITSDDSGHYYYTVIFIQI